MKEYVIDPLIVGFKYVLTELILPVIVMLVAAGVFVLIVMAMIAWPLILVPAFILFVIWFLGITADREKKWPH